MRKFLLAIFFASVGCSGCVKITVDHSCDKYSEGNFTVRVRTLPIVIGVDNSFSAEWLSELQAAADTWNEAAGKQVILIEKSTNKVYTLYNWKRTRSEQAFTRVNYIESGAITAANIFINAANFRFYTTDGVNNEFHLRSLLIHELGHAIGLGHINLTKSVMYPYLDANVERIELTDYDKEALGCMYGK